MLWDFFYALIFAFAAMGCASVFCTAPDRLQKVVLLCMMMGFTVLFAYYCAGVACDLGGSIPHIQVRDIGYNFIVWGVLISIFRIIFKEHVCKNLSEPSRPYLG